MGSYGRVPGASATGDIKYSIYDSLTLAMHYIPFKQNWSNIFNCCQRTTDEDQLQYVTLPPDIYKRKHWGNFSHIFIKGVIELIKHKLIQIISWIKSRLYNFYHNTNNKYFSIPNYRMWAIREHTESPTQVFMSSSENQTKCVHFFFFLHSVLLSSKPCQHIAPVRQLLTTLPRLHVFSTVIRII